MKRLILLSIIALTGCHHQNPHSESVAVIQIQDRNGLTETISAPERLLAYEETNFLSSQPYKKVLRVYKSGGKTRSKITTYHPNGAVWQYLEAEEMRAHGAYKEWFANGQLKIEATVIGGTADVSPGVQQDWLFDGTSQVWDEQGHLVAKIPYQKGVLEGASLYFYSSGQIEKQLLFSKNNLEGESLEYFPDGSLRAKTTYKNGIKEGLSLGFFSNGNPCWIEEYKGGLLAKALYYDLKGSVLSEIENGGGYQALFENDSLSLTVEFRHGKPEGRVQKYASGGKLKGYYHVKGGKKEGEEVEFYLESELSQNEGKPTPKLLISWHENMIHGKVKTWYSNGQLQSEREYCRNQKTGPSLSWYRDGSLMLLEEYDEDRLVKGQYYKIQQKDPVSSVINGNGLAFLYDEMGILIRKVTYVKGKAVDPES